MGNPEKVKPTDLFQLYFDEFEKDSTTMTEDEQDYYQRLMEAHNAALKEK